MERLAERAGVSKALVYLHFDNAPQVLARLYQQEVAQLAARVLSGVAAAGDPEAKLRAAVSSYLDVVQERGALFRTLMSETRGDTPASRTDDARVTQRFAAELFVDIFAVSPKAARVSATLFVGALNAGVDAWVNGDLPRKAVEDAAVADGLHLAGVRP